MKHDDLTTLRRQIDKLDDELVRLLGQRASVAKKIGVAKEDSPAYDPGREAAVLQRVAAQTAGGLSPAAIAAIYREIIAACRAAQRPLRVAYLGPEGTYSDEAARQLCGSTAQYLPISSIDEVFRTVEAGDADVAIVPAENSGEGAINRTLNLLLKTPLSISGEVALRIHHQLLSKAKTLAHVKEVVAHPQALAQCRIWLDENLPKARRVPAGSNAEAARLAAGKPTAAAIASTRAAGIYQIPALAHNIEDDPSNTTRFLSLVITKPASTGADKTSLVCATQNRSGALYKVLGVLAEQKVNMVKLESRPAPNSLWEYIFYIDIEGHQDDPHIAKTLELLHEQTVFLKILGSYPRGA